MSAVALSSTALPVRRGAAAKCTAARSAFAGRCLALPLAPVRALRISCCYVVKGVHSTGPLMAFKGCAACCVAALVVSLRVLRGPATRSSADTRTAVQAVRATRSLVVKATYETEKTEVDVDQIVKDLQTKVRVVAFQLSYGGLAAHVAPDGFVRPLTADNWVASGTVWRTRRQWRYTASARSCCCGCRPPSSQP